MSYLWQGVLVTAIAGLGAARYHERESCQRFLKEVLPLAAEELETAAATHPDTEIRRRSSLLVALHYQQTAEQKANQTLPPGWPHLPWIDMLPEDNEGCASSTMTHYLELAQAKVGKGGPPDWPDYREATRLLLCDWYASRRTAGKIPVLLQQMRDREKEWILEHGKKYNPPIELPLSKEF